MPAINPRVVDKYLAQYAVATRLPAPRSPRWQHVAVIPAFREGAGMLVHWQALARQHSFLIILVLNRPAGIDGDNRELRAACQALKQPEPQLPLFALGGNSHLLLLDAEHNAYWTAANKGVGAARKLGCDHALHWHREGVIQSPWLHSSDADACPPEDYFDQPQGMPAGTVAATLPFIHLPGPDPAVNAATALYELQLHHYVLGLRYARSPYAHHSLGSALATRMDAYAAVRGFPDRSAAEDFYLLNKLAKLGPVAAVAGRCVGVQSRLSDRVPFGTGPAVAKALAAGATSAQFYHPRCFWILRQLLPRLERLWQADSSLQAAYSPQAFTGPEQRCAGNSLMEQGLEHFVAHGRRQCRTQQQFSRQLHQWFDGFRTLKLINQLSREVLPRQTLAELSGLSPQIWPVTDNEPGRRRDALLVHWDWQPCAHPCSQTV